MRKGYKQTEEHIRSRTGKMKGTKRPVEVGLKVSETRRRLVREGKLHPELNFDRTLIPWNKGLTKETDFRIKRQSEKMVGIKYSEDRGKSISKALSGKYIGKLNWNWKGGPIPLYGWDWNKLRKRVLERDKFKCTNCGSEKQLLVHHTIPFRCMDYFLATIAIEKTDIVLYITLCKSCHSSMGRMMDKLFLESVKKQEVSK